MALSIAVIFAGAAAFLYRIAWVPEFNLSELTPRPPAFSPPEPPFDILILCDGGPSSGETWYGGTDIPQGAVFVGCRPDEDFTFDVSSTAKEVMDSSRRPQLSFVLTGSGDVRDTMLIQTSGSKTLDQRLLRLVSERRYKPSGCGTCRVAVTVPIDMKKR